MAEVAGMEARIDEGSDLMSRSASSHDRGSRSRGWTREEEEEEEEESEEYSAVDKILALRKKRDGSLEYRIEWEPDADGKPWEPSWEPEEHLTEDLISEFKEAHNDLVAAANQGRAGVEHTVPNGGAVARRERLTRPEKLLVSAVEEGATPWLESEAQLLILLDIHSTGGKSPRIISIASAVIKINVAGGIAPSSFHEYVHVRAPATSLPAVHGRSFAELQEEAGGDFKAVGTRWLAWLRARVAGKSSAARCRIDFLSTFG